jgi:hypothetical protein
MGDTGWCIHGAMLHILNMCTLAVAAHVSPLPVMTQHHCAGPWPASCKHKHYELAVVLLTSVLPYSKWF